MSKVLYVTTVTGTTSSPQVFAGSGQVYDSGSLTIAGDVVQIQLVHGTYSQPSDDPFITLGPGNYPLLGHEGDYLLGFNFAVSPLATQAATITAILYEPGKAGILSGSPSSVTTTPAAGVTSQLTYDQITAPVAFAVTSEGTAVTIISGASFTYDGMTRVRVEAWSPSIIGINGNTYQGVLLRDSAILGQWRMVGAPGVGPSTKMECFDTPAAGAHTYTWKAFGQDTNGSVGAGTGGSGNLLPAFLRVSTS